jgi:hypothetical protein
MAQAAIRTTRETRVSRPNRAAGRLRQRGTRTVEGCCLAVTSRIPGELVEARSIPVYCVAAEARGFQRGCVRRLVERGLVYRAGRGAYDFALPRFGDYLRRRSELTELTGTVRRGAAGRAEGER